MTLALENAQALGSMFGSSFGVGLGLQHAWCSGQDAVALTCSEETLKCSRAQSLCM